VFIGLVLVGIGGRPDAFHLQIQKERLQHRVIPAVGPASHAYNHTILAWQCLVSGADVKSGFNRSSQQRFIRLI
jgi:hypothetical protein